MEYSVRVEIPTDTEDECAGYGSDTCQFLLSSYCVLFHEDVVSHDGHVYKHATCPASGEKRYDGTTRGN